MDAVLYFIFTCGILCGMMICDIIDKLTEEEDER